MSWDSLPPELDPLIMIHLDYYSLGRFFTVGKRFHNISSNDDFWHQKTIYDLGTLHDFSITRSFVSDGRTAYLETAALQGMVIWGYYNYNSFLIIDQLIANPEIFDYLVQQDHNYQIMDTNLLIKIAGSGNTDLLNKIKNYHGFNDDDFISYLTICASCLGDTLALESLRKQCNNETLFSYGVLLGSIYGGDTEYIKLQLPTLGEANTDRMIAATGNIDLMKYYIGTYNNNIVSSSIANNILSGGAEYGHVSMMEYALQFNPDDMSTAMTEAIRSGKLSCIKLLVAKGCMIELTHITFALAWRRNYITLYLLDNYQADIGWYQIAQSAILGDNPYILAKLLDWVIDNHELVKDLATNRQSTRILQWINTLDSL